MRSSTVSAVGLQDTQLRSAKQQIGLELRCCYLGCLSVVSPHEKDMIRSKASVPSRPISVRLLGGGARESERVNEDRMNTQNVSVS